MTDLLDNFTTKITKRITTLNAEGKLLACDPSQKGIRYAAAYVTGKVLLSPKETRSFLEIFDGNPETALRVLREQLDTETARLLPNGVGGLTLRFGTGPGESTKRLALYTTPLYN